MSEIEAVVDAEEYESQEEELRQEFLNDQDVFSAIDAYEGSSSHEFGERFSFKATKLG
jgi:hypothetical protein